MVIENKLTEQEIDIIDMLANVWKEYSKLEEYHPSDYQEFIEAITRAQDIVISRLAIRIHPELFYRKEIKNGNH